MITWKKPEMISFSEDEIKRKIVVDACSKNCTKNVGYMPPRTPVMK